ncbi:MAG TPA: valine--tRNA ligase [Spirochaetia bacterium]|nr:valine--tRNA ligase [Spirochaetales bacterium]HRY79858.1 valine--tRNA ligase [Spirochaetia bacterium]
MKAIELAKAYAPKEFEDRIYESWESAGHFKPAGEPGKKPFVIVIPPPNVTGVLHMGHGLNNSLQDIAIRYNRMLGRPTLWVPGSDHAGIATQHVVEKKLRAKGILRRDLGREKFVEETWKVANEHHDIIKKQLEKIGSSCDWTRERFTLDEGLSKAVREVFVTLYERGLVYKGEYLVNWCTSCGTALADDEVDHADEAGGMYHIRYEIVDPPAGSPPEGGWTVIGGKAYIEIATTRPETLLGDTAVAAHPEDPRYAALIGKKVKLPLTDRTIPIIADSYVDRAFGTGLVKITPAHDPNDFEVGNRHNLERVNILTPDGRLSDAAPAKYRGLAVKEARKAVTADLEAAGLFVREEKISHSVGHCYRCHSVVEPYLSEQWFVRMKPLAEKALKVWRDGDVRFYPQRWENTYEHWLTNIRDWCISRQLWWGHRIPAWYCAHCGKTVVAREDPLECPYCKSTELTQDEDVLDTWFSSWLWPFSTLGWPKDTADLRKYYPTSVLVTGYDIIFFWVARMIMAGMEFMERSPFRDVCITTLIRDKQGRKMSKSLGNGIDPLEIVDEYGADALRFTLAFMFTASQDVLIDKEDFKLGSKFANKVWNASRYILGNLEGRELRAPGTADLSPLDRWIRHRLSEAAGTARAALETYRFNDGAQAVYEYFWNDFCDWYIEGTKLSFRSGDEAEKDRAATAILDVLEESLRLLHPFLPFVTEEIYRMLPNRRGDLIVQRYPEADAARRDPALAAEFETVMEFVRLVRNLRSEFGIEPQKAVATAVRFEAGAAAAGSFPRWVPLAALLVNGPDPEVVTAKPEGSLALVGRGFEAYAKVKDAVDGAALALKFRKEAEKERGFAERVRAKLGNESFLKSAPPEVVDKEREKLAEAERRAAKLEQYVKELA